MSIEFNPFGAVSVRQFIPRVQAAISGVDVEMAAQYIVDAAIEFARDTKILRQTIHISLVQGQTSYRLDTIHRIAEVVSIRRMGISNCGLFDTGVQSLDAHVENRVIYLRDTPNENDAGGDVAVEVSLLPSRDADELPETLYEDWAEAITFMALSKLYLLKDSAWYSLGASREHNTWYKQMVVTAKMSNITKHKPLSVRLAPRHLRGRR